MDESVPWPVKNFTEHLHPPYPHTNNSSPIDPIQKLCTIVQPPFQPPYAFSSKQISSGGNNFKQTTLKITNEIGFTQCFWRCWGWGVALA